MKSEMKTLSLVGDSYETPQVTILDVQSEGILCASGETEDYNYWEFEW